MRADGVGFAGLILMTGLAVMVLAVMPDHVRAQETVARDARIGGDLKRTRFVADLSETVEFRAFLLSDPYRVIVDLPEVNFQMPSGIGAEGRGLVSAFRYGLFAPGKSRIVIDVVGPVLIDKAFVRAAENGQPARLVLDLVSTTEAEFEAQQQQQTLMRSMSPDAFQTNTESASAGYAQKDQSGRDSGKPVIVLDPGHGGVDPGAISVGGVYEKDIVFKFAKLLKSKLEETGRYRVLMTRNQDIFVPLDGRVKFARDKRASLLISIHADALDPKHPLVNAKAIRDTRGASVYTLSDEASDEIAKMIAASENRSDVLAGVELPTGGDDDLASILIDLMHRETKNLSVSFARTLLDGLQGTTELTTAPHRFANFRVLRAQDVPSVLVELGFLSNKRDERSLTSRKWRSNVADAVVKSIGAFFAQRMVSVPG